MNKILKLFSIGLLLTVAVRAFAQNDNIVLSAYVSPDCGVPKNSQNALYTQLTNLATKCGFAESTNNRFVITAKVDVITEDITYTQPALFAYTLSFNFYIGDGFSGKLFSSTMVEAKGVGDTKHKAYMNAIRSVNFNSPQFKQFVREGKNKIIEYYNINCNLIIQKAQQLAKNQQYENALWELASIPEVCENCYYQASNMIVKIYQMQLDKDGEMQYAQALNTWNAGQDYDAAVAAGNILASINPQSKAYAKAQALSNKIAARIKQIDNRAWSLTLQQQADETAIRKLQIKAARDASVAWATHQPKVIYNIGWW